MARQCKTNNCKREAEAFCYHCSSDVCFKHYLEHKKEIQDQLPGFVDQVNLLYEQLKHKNTNSSEKKPTFYTQAHNKLSNWRTECYQHIDTVYEKTLDQLNSLVKNYQNEVNQKSKNNVESLEKIRQQLNELLKEDDVTYQQLQTMRQQLQKIKQNEQEPTRYPEFSITTERIDVNRYVRVISNNNNNNVDGNQFSVSS